MCDSAGDVREDAQQRLRANLLDPARRTGRASLFVLPQLVVLRLEARTRRRELRLAGAVL